MRSALEKLPPPYPSCARDGLQALPKSHRSMIEPTDSRRLTGSIDLDTSLAHDPVEGRKPRWDYGIGFRTRNRVRCAVWVEVHNATAGDLAVVRAKATWLRTWLSSHGTELRTMTTAAEKALPGSAFVWLAQGPVTIPKTSMTRRRLAQDGLSMPTRRLTLP